ncbi:MAG TPA: Pr6Pr family membrane protein [Rudaea sp.]|nr:Pr6Pr family membrane protein [Rudaea sp.]
MSRVYAAGLAAVAWFAVILQLVLSVEQAVAAGQGAAHGIWMYFAFFTIVTNLAVALTLALPLLAAGAVAGRFFAHPHVVTCMTASIAVVSIVYNVLLRDLWHPHGWQLLADVLMHDAVPPLFTVYWWLAVPGGSLAWRALATMCIYPIVYFFYALARGAATHFYPYPFLDVAHLGYWRVLGNGIGMLAGYVALAALLIALKRAEPQAKKDLRTRTSSSGSVG